MAFDVRNVKYLDPKNDLTFRKIFGQHPNIMKSFLNSLLPLNEGQIITDLTYEDPTMIPELPELKHSIVDVKCTDNYNRQFIVEMQMYWSSSFKSRMLFTAGKPYVKQIDKGHQYSEIRPVYGLSLVNDIFLEEEEYKNKYYHHYRLAHQEIPDETIKGIELIFIELPKFKAGTYTEKKLRNLWLRFLTEIDENTTQADADLYDDQEIKEALEHLQVSAFTKEELAYYDKYWDRVRVEKAAVQDAIDKMNKKLAEAQKREAETAHKLARRMKNYNESFEEIQKETGLSKEEIEEL